VNKQTATYASECCMQSVHRSVFLNQVHAVLLQQLKCLQDQQEEEGESTVRRQASPSSRAIASEPHGTNSFHVVGPSVMMLFSQSQL
jgi:hypothetical protein